MLIGDLNYRLNIERQEFDRLPTGTDLRRLLQFDELLQQQQTVFAPFQEPPIQFHPTYKLKLHTNRIAYDWSRRMPAWTDRCLYSPPSIIESNWYGPPVGSFEYNWQNAHNSDHLPVSCSLVIKDDNGEKPFANARLFFQSYSTRLIETFAFHILFALIRVLMIYYALLMFYNRLY